MARIDLTGAGVVLYAIKIAPEIHQQLAEYLENDDDGLDGLVLRLMDDAPVNILGMFADKCALLVDGDEWNGIENIDDVGRSFEISSYPMKQVLELETGELMLFTCEYEVEEFFGLEIQEDFDEDKLKFILNHYELPDGDEIKLVTAKYDGVLLDYQSPHQKSFSRCVYDFFGKVVLKV